MNPSTRSAQKRYVIMESARTLFLRNGYTGTSMDEVAALAAVSKQTVYKHFADKKRLFTEIITADISAAEELTTADMRALAHSEDLPADLRAFARRHITTVLQPHLVQMRRVIIAAAERFPDLAATWYASGPGRAHTALATLFAQLTERGLLNTPDPPVAAQHFNWLILSIPLNHAMFHAADTPFPESELHHYADEGTRVFLAAYSAH
ncbi:TetR/AcrR family transcriptional regulator [Acrocarpospora catenulata]|uniref:TetR/AcrR family transcriptional regulator n=1 Tax=Acrocarpospora catenulata TaxID=2836182 RepID=UPI0027E0E9BE|nr:TetR/AcrR family transcriptional regulator [Acrocarpospora catenulata]